MDNSTHTPPRPPLPVVERCAATDGRGLYGGCHGATASGVNELAAENAATSLRILAEDMRESYEQWVKEQAATR